MKLNILLSITSVYLALIGIGFIFAPLTIGTGAVPEDASPALIAYLRMFGPPFLGIAVLNWRARNAPPSATRTAIIVGNIAGFGIGPLLDVWGMFSGARPLAIVFAILHLLITLAFVIGWRTNMPSESHSKNT